MADENEDDLVVNIDDLDTVQVNVDDNPKLAQEPEHIKKEQKKEKTRRISPVDDQQIVKTGPSPEEALQQAQAYSKTQEDARRAAEATAANERSMREQAQREAQQAQQTANQLKERAENSELAVIENGIAAASQQVDSLQEEFTRAAEAGEFAKMGQIQTKISKAAAALDRLENQKLNFEVKPTTEGRVEAQPTIQQSPFEKYLSGFSPVAQNWLRQHPECAPAQVGGSQSKNSLMMAGHYAALAKNLSEGSTEYFKEIENHITPAEAQPVIDTKVQSRAAEVVVAGEKKTVVPSAPVSRDTQATGAPRSVREVRLTKDQQEMAKVSFPHLPESQAFGQYARNLIELEAEGKIGRMTH